MEFLCSFTPASNDRSTLKCTSTPQKAPREETAELHLALLRMHARVATNPGESAAIANCRVTFPQDRDLYIPPTFPHGLSRTLLHFHRAEPCGAPLEAARSLGRAPAGAAAHPCPARFGRSGARSALPRPAPPRENSGQAAPPAAVRARCTAPRTRRSGCSRCRGGRAGSGRSSRWGARTAVPGTPAGNDSDEGGRGGGRGPAVPRRTCRPPRLLQVKAAPGYPLSASSSSWIIPLRAAARAAGRGARAAGKGASAPRPPEGSRAAPRPRGAAEAGAGLARPGGRARSAGGSPPGPGSNGRMGERAGFPEESPGAAGRAGLVRCPPLRSWGALAWPQEDG